MLNYTEHIKKIILILVSLQVLNVGLFAQNITESNLLPNQNVINSVTEFLHEIVLNKTNQYPENNKKDHQNQHHKSQHNSHIKNFSVKFSCPKTNFITGIHYVANYTKQKFLLLNENAYSEIIFEITPPPPKA